MSVPAAPALRPISLELGYPGLAPPPEAIARAARSLARSAEGSGYPPPEGLATLRRAIAAAAGVEPEWVTVTHGASAALTAAIVALTEPGEVVLCPDPGFPAFAAAAAATGRRVRRYDAAAPERVDKEVAAGLARGAGLVVLNSPSNPLGTALPALVVARVRALAAEHGTAVVADEVYVELVYDGELARVAPREGERLVAVRSFSKSYGLPSFRVGYALAPPALARELARAHWRLNMSVSEIGQEAALGALGNADYLPWLRAELRARRDHVCDLLATAGVPHRLPEAGLFLWIEVGDGERFAAACRREYALALSPGSAFGQSGAAYVRLSFGGPEADAIEGACRLARAFCEERS